MGCCESWVWFDQQFVVLTALFWSYLLVLSTRSAQSVAGLLNWASQLCYVLCPCALFSRRAPFFGVGWLGERDRVSYGLQCYGRLHCYFLSCLRLGPVLCCALLMVLLSWLC
jgi:hypothetical protein